MARVFTFVSLLFTVWLVHPTAAQWQKIAQKDGGSVDRIVMNRYGDLFSTSLLQFYTSVDQGQSWQKRKNPTDNLVIYLLYPSADSNGITSLIAAIGIPGDPSNVFMRYNATSDTWTEMNSLLESLKAVRGRDSVYLYSTRYGDLFAYASTSKKLYRSRDNGVSFNTVATLTGVPSYVFQSLDSTCFVEGNRIEKDGSLKDIGAYVVVAASQEFFNAPVVLWARRNNFVYRSSNKGDQWTSVTYNLPNRLVSALTTGRDGEAYCFSEYSSDSMVVFRLSSGASLWSVVHQQSYTFKDVLAYQNGKMVAASDQGAFVSEEGATAWSPSSGISSYGIRVATQPSQNSLIIGGADGDVWRTTSQGLSWSKAQFKKPVSQSTIFTDCISTAGGTVVMTSSRGMFYSKDEGATFNQCTSNDIPIEYGVHSITAVDANTLIASSTNGLLKSTDDGATWTVINTQLKGDFKLASSGDGSYYISADKLFRGNASTNTVEVVDTNVLDGPLSVNARGDIAALNAGDSTPPKVFLLRRLKGESVFKRIDLPGAVSVGNGFPFNVTLLPNGDAYIGTQNGFFSVSASKTTAEKSDLDGSHVLFLRQDNKRKERLLAATLSGGIFEVTGTVGVVDQSDDDGSVALPNPATDWLRIDIPSNLQYVSVYSALGTKYSVPTQVQETELSVYVRSLFNGAYYAELKLADGKRINVRFVVLHD